MSEKAVGSVRAQQLDEERHVTGEVRQVRARARRYDERQVRNGMAPTRRPQPRPKAPARRGRAQSDTIRRNQSQSVAISRNQSQSTDCQVVIKWSSVAIKWPTSGHQVAIKWSSSGHHVVISAPLVACIGRCSSNSELSRWLQRPFTRAAARPRRRRVGAVVGASSLVNGRPLGGRPRRRAPSL